MKRNLPPSSCVALVAIAIVGASLAYFTDTDKPPTRLQSEM